MKQQAEENSLGCGTELCCLHSCTELFAGSLEQQNSAETASCGNSSSCGTESENSANSAGYSVLGSAGLLRAANRHLGAAVNLPALAGKQQ